MNSEFVCPINNAASAVLPFFSEWLETRNEATIIVLSERSGGREQVRKALITAVADHFRSIDDLKGSIERLGFASSIQAFQNTVPLDVRTRSGDLGEILCTEYIMQSTDFKVPVKKLRWKDDRNRTMRGNDVLAFRTFNRVVQVLKAESKSRTNLSNSVVEEAEQGILQHNGRPNPSSLAFLQSRLMEANRVVEADFISKLQLEELNVQNFRHLIFTLSGNDPATHLKSRIDPHPEFKVERELVGLHIIDHQDFIASIYDGCLNGNF